MKNPNAIVSSIIRLDPPLKGSPAEMLRAQPDLSVELEGGRRVRLDPENPRSPGFIQVLDGLSKQHLPVYLEIEPNTSMITRLLVAKFNRIVNVQPAGKDALDVELEYSHARHTLLRGQEDFDELEKVLHEAMRNRDTIILTEDDRHNIIDVRFFKPGPDEPLPPLPEPKFPKPWPGPLDWLRKLFKWIWYWPWWPWWPWFRCVSGSRAQQVFDAMSATSCNPLSVPVPCIPFLYPDDGCWGRAHEMCRLMIGMGVSPKKVWIQGRLYVNTRNNPDCYVRWGWHVAPTLCVHGPGLFQSNEMVIDPSLFITPVTQSMWKSIQGDPAATLTPTPASYFRLNGTTDPTYVYTNSVLAQYRMELLARALNLGPPPYANCP